MAVASVLRSGKCPTQFRISAASFMRQLRIRRGGNVLSCFCTVSSGEEEEHTAKNLLELYQQRSKFVGKRRHFAPELIPIHQEIERELDSKKIVKHIVTLEKREWKPRVKRAGAIGTKIGMSSLWLKDGKQVAVTLIEIKECEVIAPRIGSEYGGKSHITAVEVGGVNEHDLSQVHEKQFERFVRQGSLAKKKVASFKVNLDGLMPTGTRITASHFVPDQFVTIQGTSIDHGFQGVMKRWGMKGQPASHGQTKTHRKMGATGGGTNPGRIFPGKKMPGHMGNKKVTVTHLRVLRLNTKHNVLYVKGNVPGPRGGLLRIQDTLVNQEAPVLPYPTYIPTEGEDLPEDLYSDLVHTSDSESLQFGGVEIESKKSKGKSR